ncbi:LLM class flavin-dependent oxidoreductase [Candidatus Thorarchaeota archaeon]|nr:MAG: LLM class flavin-dependent oxidoreductase [Candidatus Thorarchaeota archaeon]
MNFGVQVEPQFGYSFKDVVAIAEAAVTEGYSTLWFSDHFMLDKEATDRELLDPWLLMTGLVYANDQIRVGTLVACNNYRPPALHAKMAATLDVLSEGRFEFGIGAGWKEMDYRAFGLEYHDDMTRIRQLAEGIEIIRGAWTEDVFNYDGEYYNAENLISNPKPVQDPHPRVWVGTMKGRRHMLDVAARHGDGINLAWAFTPEDLKRIFSKLDELLKKYNRTPGSLSRSVGLWTRYFRSEQDMEEYISSAAKERGIEVDLYRRRVSKALWGTSEMMVSRLREYYDVGVEHVIFMFPHENEVEQMGALSKHVLPHI